MNGADGNKHLFHVDMTTMTASSIQLDFSGVSEFSSAAYLYGFTSVNGNLYAFSKPDSQFSDGAYFLQIDAANGAVSKVNLTC